jgi:hypothetical protein
MSGPADIERFPPPALVAPATPTTPGTVPQYPIPQAGVDGLPAALAARDAAATGTVPAFVAGAASIAPGTDNASRYVIEAARTLDQASALTLATTDSPAVGNKLIACYALALGETLSIVNGGPLAGTLATIAASRTNPIGVVLWWNGANYSFNGYVELGAP